MSQLLSKVTVTFGCFYIKCSICRLAAGRYALLKCVVTEAVLFSVVAFKTLTFHINIHKVARQSRCGGIFSDSILLPIFS